MPLARHTYMRIGGPARYLATPEHMEGLETLLVETAERRAPISRNEPCRTEPCRFIQTMLVQQNAKQRLDAGDKHPTIREQKFVVERHFLVAHRNFFPFGPPLTLCTII